MTPLQPIEVWAIRRADGDLWMSGSSPATWETEAIARRACGPGETTVRMRLVPVDEPAQSPPAVTREEFDGLREAVRKLACVVKHDVFGNHHLMQEVQGVLAALRGKENPDG